ncbi:MAG: hypothetical protein QW046_05685 [Candidatus Micrarchaeaceae archaeon]|uniref:hypothetical protein n=1 Tax=Saccharolobus sp. TaxID=2100761 RepID=UPI003160D517
MQDLKVEVVDQTQPLGVEITLYTFKCKICGRIFAEVNKPNLVVNEARYHLKMHGTEANSLVIGKMVVEI